jgi:hypothetical protein
MTKTTNVRAHVRKRKCMVSPVRQHVRLLDARKISGIYAVFLEKRKHGYIRTPSEVYQDAISLEHVAKEKRRDAESLDAIAKDLKKIHQKTDPLNYDPEVEKYQAGK